MVVQEAAEMMFQSTLPVGGGTGTVAKVSVVRTISIHPPRVGRDGYGRRQNDAAHKFQSTLPVWGGTELENFRAQIERFQSTLPVWGGTSAPR